MAMMAQGAPPILPMPVTAASESPVRTWSLRTRTWYETRGEKTKGSMEVIQRWASSNVPGSMSDAIRNLAEML